MACEIIKSHDSRMLAVSVTIVGLSMAASA
jgi:hypothetical protein